MPELESFVAGPAGAPWVTFVPGIGNDATFWADQAAGLTATHRTLRFEPWGVGASEPPPAGCTIDAVVEAIIRLWDEHGIERSSLVGLGFGGSVVLRTGSRHPERVERLAAFACRPRQPADRREFWRARQARARAEGLAAVGRTTVERWLSPELRRGRPEVAAELLDGFARGSIDGYCALVDAFVSMDLRDDLARIEASTLLVAAEHDHGGGPVPDMEAMARVMPNADLAIIAGSGHLMNREQSQQVTALLTRFMAS